MDKRYRRSGNGILSGMLIFLVVMVLAVGAGFLCTKYIIYPYILGGEAPFGTSENGKTLENNGEDQSQTPEGNPSIVEDGQDITGSDGTQETSVGTSEQTPVPEQSNTGTTAADTDSGHTNAVNLYTIQYGSFTTEEGARQVVSSLQAAGIGAILLVKDGIYKVVEEPYASEERARAVLPDRKSSFGDAVFLTTMEAWL